MEDIDENKLKSML